MAVLGRHAQLGDPGLANRPSGRKPEGYCSPLSARGRIRAQGQSACLDPALEKRPPAPSADPHEADRFAQSAQDRAVLDHHPPLERLARCAVGEHCLRHDHLATAALVLEARGGIDRRAEVIEHAAGGDRDAGAKVQAKLERAGARASPLARNFGANVGTC
jgi:hypothetical protein